MRKSFYRTLPLCYRPQVFALLVLMQLFLDLIVNFLQCLVFPAFHQYRMEYLAQRIAQAPQAFSELMAVFVFALQQPEPAAHQAYPLNQAEPEFEFSSVRYIT